MNQEEQHLREQRDHAWGQSRFCSGEEIKAQEKGEKEVARYYNGLATAYMAMGNRLDIALMERPGTPQLIVKRDRAWHLYPNGTKAVSPNGGHYVREPGGWKWCKGDIFPTPAADVDRVILPEPPVTDVPIRYERRKIGHPITGKILLRKDGTLRMADNSPIADYIGEWFEDIEQTDDMMVVIVKKQSQEYIEKMAFLALHSGA